MFDATPETTETAAAAQTQQDRFHITDSDGANWYLRKLANLEGEKARVARQAAQMVAELESDIRGLRHLYDSELEAFARAELARTGGRRKTLTLMQGTVAFRSVGPSFRFVPGGAAADALDRAQEIGATITAIDAAAYTRAAEEAFAATGELLPGVERTEARESFRVSFGNGKDAAGKEG